MVKTLKTAPRSRHPFRKPEPVKEIYKNSSQESGAGAGPFFEEADEKVAVSPINTEQDIEIKKNRINILWGNSFLPFIFRVIFDIIWHC